MLTGVSNFTTYDGATINNEGKKEFFKKKMREEIYSIL